MIKFFVAKPEGRWYNIREDNERTGNKRKTALLFCENRKYKRKGDFIYGKMADFGVCND